MTTPHERDLTEATRQVAALSAAGVPLASGLRALATEAPTSRLRNLFEQLAQQLEKGVPLNEALASLPNLPAGLTQIVQLGQQTGQPDFFIPEFLEHRQEMSRLYVHLLATFLYPSLLVLACLVGVTYWFASFVVGMFTDTFTKFRTPLPITTRVVLSVCTWISEHRGALSVLMCVLVGIFILAWIPWFRGQALQVIAKVVPYVGKAASHRATSGFCRMLAVLLETRVSLPIALRAAGNACGYSSLRDSSVLLASAAERGQDLEQIALTEISIFPDLAHALRWTKDGDLFTRTLRGCAELHHQQAIASKGVSLMFLENVGLSLIPLGVGVIVILVYVSFFFPLLRLLNNLS